MDSKELTILNKECELIIGLDRSIKFVGIIDRNAKLLIGKSRDNNSNNGPSNRIIGKTAETNTSIIEDSYYTTRPTHNQFGSNLEYNSLHLFYSDLLLLIKKSSVPSYDSGNNSIDPSTSRSIGENRKESYFYVSGCSKDYVDLVATPLDLNLYRFLCIYFEPPSKIGNPINGIEESFEYLLNKIKTNANHALLRIDRLHN
jgi:hypothetical protein